MKTAVVYHQFTGQGGLERYLLGFVRALMGAGHGVEVVTARTDGATRGAGAGVHMVPGGRVKTGRNLLDFDRRSREIVAGLGCDVVLGFGRTTRQDIHRAGGGCHKVYSRMLTPYRRARRKNRIELELEEELYRGGGTRRFVVNSELVGRQLREEYGVPGDRFKVIRTAVDSGRFAPDRGGGVRGRVRDELGVKPGRTVFLYVAREHRRKGLGPLIRAFPNAAAELWVVGPPPAMRMRGKAGGNIRFLGDERDLPDLYRAADYFVHPTAYDACANTVLQSMSTALPGIISVCDGASEFIEDGVNGFLLENPWDSDVITTALVRAMDQADTDRAEMGELARKTVAPLTWEAHVDSWLGLIEEL